ncbi:Hypp9391 [Branchiostoma lanceolatum]|uniref:Hypp9391 protein n=1 Tax=Branchiostoma lanceolatum TaxID=7740 RepID=A0A8S4MLZ8_BRALA|nr:Hypp9391 [Branchiostoma lanceolatum]
MDGVGDKGPGNVSIYFYSIKEEVSSYWKDLAYHLGFKQADINNIANRNKDDKSCCMDLLEEWLKRKGKRATIDALMDALTNAGLQNIVDGLKNKDDEDDKFPESIKAPDGLKALETTNDSVKIGWTKARSCKIDGYRLEQSIAYAEKWTTVHKRKVLSAMITEFTVVNLTPYEEYHFCVTSALDKTGKLVFSERSKPLKVLTRKQYQPYPPRKIKLEDHTHASLLLTWKEPEPVDDVKPACYEYVVEMCLHSKDRTMNTWTEYCRTAERQCTINVRDNGVYRFRVSANNTEKKITSLPEEIGDPDVPIHIETQSESLLQFLKAHWPFSATTQPRSQETGSIIFNISYHDLDGLRELWMNYKLGKVKKFFENLFARQARLASVKTDTELTIKIDKEHFYTCRRHLLLTRPTSTQLGLSEDYPVYCKPISHKTTCSQLDFLDPAVPTDQLDLAVAREDQYSKDISKLSAAVRTGREKSQRLEVQLHTVKAQLETERQETKALRVGVTKLTEEKEKAQKVILEQKI